MSTSVHITKKIWIPEEFGRILKFVPDKYTDMDGLADFFENIETDYSNIECIVINLITLYGHDIADFLRDTTSEYGNDAWEFDIETARELVSIIDDDPEREPLEDEEQLQKLKDVLIREIEKETDWFQVDIW